MAECNKDTALSPQAPPEGARPPRLPRECRHVAFAPSVPKETPHSRIAFSNEEGNDGKAEDLAAVDALGRPLPEPEGGDQGEGPEGRGGSSLKVRLGMLKCGYRYECVVDVPGMKRTDDDDSEAACREQQPHLQEEVTVEPILDSDLAAEIVESLDEEIEEKYTDEEDGCGGRRSVPPRPSRLRIVLTARRPGNFAARFDLSQQQRRSSMIDNLSSVSLQDSQVEGREGMAKRTTHVTVEATLMERDRGTPQLKAGVMRLGKLAGYESDEETEWQGFD